MNITNEFTSGGNGGGEHMVPRVIFSGKCGCYAVFKCCELDVDMKNVTKEYGKALEQRYEFLLYLEKMCLWTLQEVSHLIGRKKTKRLCSFAIHSFNGERGEKMRIKLFSFGVVEPCALRFSIRHLLMSLVFVTYTVFSCAAPNCGLGLFFFFNEL